MKNESATLESVANRAAHAALRGLGRWIETKFLTPADAASAAALAYLEAEPDESPEEAWPLLLAAARRDLDRQARFWSSPHNGARRAMLALDADSTIDVGEQIIRGGEGEMLTAEAAEGILGIPLYPQERKVLLALSEASSDYASIAARCGMTRSAVAQTVMRVRQRLGVKGEVASVYVGGGIR